MSQGVGRCRCEEYEDFARSLAEQMEHATNTSSNTLPSTFCNPSESWMLKRARKQLLWIVLGAFFFMCWAPLSTSRILGCGFRFLSEDVFRSCLGPKTLHRVYIGPSVCIPCVPFLYIRHCPLVWSIYRDSASFFRSLQLTDPRPSWVNSFLAIAPESTKLSRKDSYSPLIALFHPPHTEPLTQVNLRPSGQPRDVYGSRQTFLGLAKPVQLLRV